MAKIGIECEVSDKKRDEIFDIVSDRTRSNVKQPEEDIDRIYEWYNTLSNSNSKFDDFFDNKLSYIGTGIVALSMSFTEKARAYSPKWLIITGCILVSASVIINLLSFLSSRRKCDKYIEQMNCYLKGDKKGFMNPSVDEQTRILKIHGYIFNWICFILLFLGAIFISIFIYINLCDHGK